MAWTHRIVMRIQQHSRRAFAKRVRIAICNNVVSDARYAYVTVMQIILEDIRSGMLFS
jgi:hypothetical protein